MQPVPSAPKSNNKKKLLRFFATLFEKLSIPIKCEILFFILFFLLISLSTFKSLLGGIIGRNLDFIVLEGLARGVAVSYIFTTVLYMSGSKWLKITFYVIGMSLFSLNVFLWLVFHLIIQPQIITFIGETNTQEATEFLSTFLLSRHGLLSILIICIVTTIVVAIELKHKAIDRLILQKTNRKVRTAFLSLIMLIALFGFSKFDIYYEIAKSRTTDDLTIIDPFPYDTVTSMIFSLNSIRTTNNEIRQAINSTCNVEKGIIANNDPLNVIYILGESYIKYHSNLYGYPLITTPRLTKERDSGNLYVFNDVISAYAGTSLVVRNTFCCNSLMDKEKWYRTPFFPTIFKKSNFNVYYWDNQRIDVTEGLTGFTTNSFLFNKTIVKISYTQAPNKVFRYDDQLIQDYFKTPKPTGKHNLIIFHLWGQHVGAASRYPHNSTFEKFVAKDIKRSEPYLTESKKQDIANYDNATFYNDSVISHIINHYKNSNSVVVYMSDHGEEIYDYRDSKGRVASAPGQNKEFLKYQFGIPFFIWCSDIYKKKHPQLIKHIRAALNKPFMTDNVCQIFFDLSGLNTKYYIPQRDLLSPKFKIRERILGNGQNYDKIMRDALCK